MSRGRPPAASRRAPHPPGPGRGRLARLPGWIWGGTGWLALGLLLFACRGAPLGVAVADDYAYLRYLRFHRGLDLFDSLGLAFYWRPLSRQVYFSAVGPWLLAAPWAAALLHALLLLALFAAFHRAARRVMAPPLAAAVAVFPLLSESSRVLLAWPSGVHYLLLLAAVALALDAALAGRRLIAAMAALAALLAHESGLLVLAAFPLAAWFRSRRLRDALAWGGLALAVAAAWGGGVGVALAHGVVWPRAGGSAASLAAEVPRLLATTFVAQLNLEDLGLVNRRLLVVGYAALGLAAGAAAGASAPVRARLRAAAPLVLAGAVWFVAASLPLVFVMPWNAWRSGLPSLGLGAALTAALGAASPWLAGALAVLRAIALVVAPAAAPLVSTQPPESVSQLSFTRLARMQRTVDATRRALLERFPALPPGAQVRYWTMPRIVDHGFLGGAALQVWYGDSTMSWRGFGGEAGYREHVDALVQFNADKPEFATAIEPAAYTLMARGVAAAAAGRLPAADSLFSAAFRAQPPPAPHFYAGLARKQARVAYNLGDRARADSLNQLDLRFGGEGADHAAFAAILALDRGDRAGAIRWLNVCLGWNPKHEEGRALAERLRLRLPP